MGKRKKALKNAKGNGAKLGFESTLWQAADKLRNNLHAAEYKHVVLGLIFLKYISDAFKELHQKLVAGFSDGRQGPVTVVAPRCARQATRPHRLPTARASRAS